MRGTRREFLKQIGLGAGLLSLGGCASVNSKVSQSRPNILFIMSDDHATHAISCYGSKINTTPHIDRLAQQGMLFRQMMVTNSLCAPARAVLLTGKFSHKNGFLQNGYSFDGSQQTFPKLLQNTGYETAVIGKWHLRSEPTGFDYYNVMPGHGRFFDCRFKKKGKTWRDGTLGGTEIKGYLTDTITDLSIDWLKTRKTDKPFCLLVHHKAPHEPHDPDDKHAEMYKDVEIPEPPTLYDDWETRPAMKKATGCSKIADCNYPEYEDLIKKYPDQKERTRQMYQAYMKGYLRLVASLDDNVGRILDYIDSNGLKENTIVIYTSDNGFFLGDHGFFNKMWMYEQALYVPLIIRYPKEVTPGSSNDAMIQNIDFAPTFLEYAGVSVPDDLQGRSFRSFLKSNTPKNWRDKVYYHYYEGYDIPNQYGVRTKTHKLICYPDFTDQPYWELFDLVNDPMELRDVYNEESYKEIVKQLKKDLEQLRNEYQDTNDISGLESKTAMINHLAVGCPVKLLYPCSEKHSGSSSSPLTDGIINNVSPPGSSYFDKWLGFEVDDLHATIDLQKEVEVSRITARFLEKPESWVFAPKEVRIQVSRDGNVFTDLDTGQSKELDEGGTDYIHFYQASMKNKTVRYIRVHAKNVAVCPKWHHVPGGKAWLFADEIIVK